MIQKHSNEKRKRRKKIYQAYNISMQKEDEERRFDLNFSILDKNN